MPICSAMSSIKRFNSQPPEGGWWPIRQRQTTVLSFNSQPPEGGWLVGLRVGGGLSVSTHSRPKAAGAACSGCRSYRPPFQLTAARRRLGASKPHLPRQPKVSTHSRPKAAGRLPAPLSRVQSFQLTAARRRLDTKPLCRVRHKLFQLTAARRRLVFA